MIVDLPLVSRRGVLGGALVLGLLPSGIATAQVSAATPLNAWISIAADGHLVVGTPAAEMGQGIYTSLPKIIVDELGGDWETTEIRLTPGDPAFINPKTKDQSTGRSMSVRGYYPLLRKLGAQAREMLRTAAAQRLGVPVESVRVLDGRIVAGSRSLSFADVAADAARLPVPADPPLKKREELKLIGKRTPAKDAGAKTAGRAIYAGDMHLPGMLVATVIMSPVFGGTVKRFNQEVVAALPGVRAVVPFGGSVLDQLVAYEAGIAVVADSFWQAKQGLDALEIEWGPGRADGASSAKLASERKALSDGKTIVAVTKGDVAGAAKDAAGTLDLYYDVPFLAHATMEPMSCVAHVEADRTTLWAPSQGPLGVRRVVAKLLGQDPERVTVNRTFLGGGFGRRWQRDFAIQAAEISKAVGRPIKLLWTREEDMRHDFYRPAMGMRARASFDAEKRLTGVRMTTIGPSISAWQRAQDLPRRPDVSAVAGLDDMHYAFDPVLIEWAEQITPFPIGVWRGVGHSQNGFFLESLVDEIAHYMGEDPYRYRRKLLAKHPRMQRVLDRAAEAIGWDKPLPKGHGRGIAFMESYGSPTAHAAQVSVRNGALKIERIVAVIDPGLVVDPYTVEAQMQGGAIFALSAMLHGEITMTDGRVDQSLFTDYNILTLAETPPVEVHALESDGEEIGGVGENGVPTVAPAVANAIFAASGTRIRRLPLKDAKL